MNGLRAGLTWWFPTPVLLSLLALSMLTNAILLVRLNRPSLWRDVVIALTPAPRIAPADHVRGRPDARVTVIEYGDFQCPFCAEFHRSMRRILSEHDARWVYRHFPLDRIHPLAARAAEASECAGEQGRFWEYADSLFEVDELTESVFDGIASALALELPVFQGCLASRRFGALVDAQRRDAIERKMTGTPTFYVNGTRFDGTLSYADLERVFVQNGG